MRQGGTQSLVRGLPSLCITASSTVNALGVGDAVLARLRAATSGLVASATVMPELPFHTMLGYAGRDLATVSHEHRAWDSRVLALLLTALRDVANPVHIARGRFGSQRVGLFLGTSTGGLDKTEWAYEHLARTGALPNTYTLPKQHDFFAAAAVVKELLGIEGPAHVVSTACSSSGKVFATAARMIRLGFIDAALVGGADALCRMTLQGFHGLGILSANRCEPFGLSRNGINIGEGAALVLLERRTTETDRIARGYLRGVGESADAHNMSSPDPEGLGARTAMQRAMQQGGVLAEEIDHINAHGTATTQNDAAESTAIAGVFAQIAAEHKPWVSSTKGYVGHLLGAAGATEAVFALDALHSLIPRSLGSDTLDPACVVRVAHSPVRMCVRNVLSNSFAFGGSNCCLAISREPNEDF